MSYRKDKLSHFVRDVVSEAIANRVSDPRVSTFTSVTRVEISPDLKFANVHVSVMGSDADGRTTMRGLQSARGMIQTRLAKQLNIRQCPIIRFHLDEGIKRAIETIETIDGLDTRPVPPGAGPDAEHDRAPMPSASQDEESSSSFEADKE